MAEMIGGPATGQKVRDCDLELEILSFVSKPIGLL
jgi:hypothetical protein